mgnify:FL=1|tara:strand:+ start:3303 stop:3839 length:537 start_codon:yes stop_codon:yes gene_type:complete
MVKITMDFDPNLTNVRDDFNLMPDAIMEVTADAIEQTALDIKGDVVSEMNQPYPQGLGSDRALKLAVEIDGNRELANGLATYYVGTKLPYAQYVEYGSGPHSATSGDGSFMKSIIEWTERVIGGDRRAAESIAKSIRKNGIKPRPYFRKAVVKEAPNFKLTWSTMLAERLEAEFENIT